MQTLDRLAHAHQRVVFVYLNGGQISLEFYDFARKAGGSNLDDIVEPRILQTPGIDDGAGNPGD